MFSSNFLMFFFNSWRNVDTLPYYNQLLPSFLWDKAIRVPSIDYKLSLDDHK